MGAEIRTKFHMCTKFLIDTKFLSRAFALNRANRAHTLSSTGCCSGEAVMGAGGCSD